MNKITRNNYEQFAIDYIENNLAEHTKADFDFFLEQNPDIKQEIQELAEIEIAPEKTKYPNKITLKKSPVQGLSYFEYLCISDIEKTITQAEKNELENLLKDSRNHDEYRLFALSKIKKERKNFPHKNYLKKSKTISLYRNIISISAAAIILLFFGIKIFFSGVNNQISAPVNTITDFTTRKFIEPANNIQPQTNNTNFDYYQNKIVVENNIATDVQDTAIIQGNDIPITEIFAQIIPKDEINFRLTDTAITLQIQAQSQKYIIARNTRPRKPRNPKLEPVKIINMALQGFEVMTESDLNMKLEVDKNCYKFDIKDKTYNLCLK